MGENEGTKIARVTAFLTMDEISEWLAMAAEDYPELWQKIYPIEKMVKQDRSSFWRVVVSPVKDEPPAARGGEGAENGRN